jgi:NitT/TauT family transport system ATP-binding protein
VLDVDLPRPRPLAIRESAEFAASSGRIRGLFEKLGEFRKSV